LRSLDAQRHTAALASGGGSNEVIHRLFLKIVEDLDLGGDVLDFGSGTGALTRCLASLGRFSSVTAIDLIEFEPRCSDSVVFMTSDLNESTDLKSSMFDVIVAAEVIEHLENPRAVAREWFRLLKPGGVLIFSTPNNESWRSLMALLVRGHFVAFGDSCYPAHITALVRKDIERILLESGFTPPRFFFTDTGGIPKLPGVKWQTISGGLLKGLRYSDNLVAVSQKMNNSAE
jgi:2-polyprenyl-3-methyl-5-hydroxy-6-metoxy-1,4-benzoquinol methylase